MYTDGNAAVPTSAKSEICILHYYEPSHCGVVSLKMNQNEASVKQFVVVKRFNIINGVELEILVPQLTEPFFP